MDIEGVCFIEDAWTVQVRVDDGLYTKVAVKVLLHL